MTGRITGRQFLSYEGIEDWRPIFGGGWACAYFRTGSFESGVALVGRIGALAAAADHYPHIDLRPEGVTVRCSPGCGSSSADATSSWPGRSPAPRASWTPRWYPSRVQHVQVAIDAMAPGAVGRGSGGWCSAMTKLVPRM